MGRTIQVNIRVSEDELSRIDANAKMAGMSRSAYIIACAADEEKKFTVPSRLLGVPKPKKRSGYYPDESATWIYEDRHPGAPRKSFDGGLRSESLSMRVSKFEKRTIERRSEQDGLSVTDYMMKKAVYTEDDIVPFDRDAYMRTFSELQAQGRNLNQIAAALNRIASIAWRDDVDGELIDSLVRDVLDDNARTRSGINDALSSIRDAAAGSRLPRR